LRRYSGAIHQLIVSALRRLQSGSGEDVAGAKTDHAALPRILLPFCLSSRCRALSFLIFEAYDHALKMADRSVL
jgi:hypothetical protein